MARKGLPAFRINPKWGRRGGKGEGVGEFMGDLSSSLIMSLRGQQRLICDVEKHPFCSRGKARMYHSDTLRGEPSWRLTPKSIASSPERSPVSTRGFYTSPALKVALNPLYTVVELLLLLNWTQTMFLWLCIELGFVLPHRRLVRIGPYSPDIDLGSPSTTYASRNST